MKRRTFFELHPHRTIAETFSTAILWGLTRKSSSATAAIAYNRKCDQSFIFYIFIYCRFSSSARAYSIIYLFPSHFQNTWILLSIHFCRRRYYGVHWDGGGGGKRVRENKFDKVLDVWGTQKPADTFPLLYSHHHCPSSRGYMINHQYRHSHFWYNCSCHCR